MEEDDVLITAEYDVNFWEYDDAVDNAETLASDLGGEIDEIIKATDDDEAHIVTILILHTDISDIKDGMREIISGLVGIHLKIEST